MTLADWIRKYLEDRRRACEQKYQYLDFSSNNSDVYTDHNQDDNVITLSNDQFFSNDIDPKRRDQLQGSKRKTYQKSIGVSRSSRIRTLPDGTIEVETIIKDSNGKEEKYVTYQKDGKKYTKIFRTGPSGEEEVEERLAKEGEGVDVEIFPRPPFSRSSESNLDSGYDYWYDRFFKERQPGRPNVTISDPIATMDEQLEKILREFGLDGLPRDENSEDGMNIDDRSFNSFLDAPVHEEMRKMFENFGLKDFNADNIQKGSNKQLGRQVDRIFKTLTPAKPPTLFEEFAEDAYVELPDDITPFDKFIEPDEERLAKLKPKLQKSKEMLEKLDQYFADQPNRSFEPDIYSDIEDPKGTDFPLLLPRPQPEFPPSIPNLDDILRKTLDPNKFVGSGNIQTQMYFGNGKRRTESISKDKDGNTEKNIMYEIGDQQYNVKIVTNRFGVEIKREKSLNFPERDLTKFKKQWGKAFVTDFMDD